MMPQPPSGQGPVDPRGAFSPPPPPPPPQQQHGGGVPSYSTGGAPQPPPPQMHPSMPPPMMMPPPMFYPPPPPQRGGFARAIFLTLATSIFGLSLLANIYLLMLSGLASSESGTRTNMIAAGDPSQKIAVIPIDDVIDTPLRDRFERIVRQIESDKTVKAIVIEVDTPGGTVTASDEIYNRIRKLKTDRNIPIITAMGGLATSGGYYVACATDEIFVQPTTLTGNIGVVMQRFNYSGAMEKIGVQDASITPRGAHFKNLGSPFRPETEEATTYLRGFAEDFYGQFKSIVSTGRKGKLKDSIDVIADGRVYTASDAMKLGLVDHTGYYADAYDHAAKLASLSNPTIVRYQHQPSFFDLLSVKWSGFGSSSSGGGPSVSIDSRLLHELTTPRAMYIWRGE